MRMRTIASFSVVLMITIVLASDGVESARAKPHHGRDNSRRSECEMVDNEFPYCLDFLTGLTDTMDPRCCRAINELNMAAKNGVGASTICRCIEAIAKGLEPPLRYYQISKLPSMCTTHLSFPISEAINCKFP